VWPAWRAVAHQWDIASTGPYIGARISPVAAEFVDLALRLGRLAYRNPQWTPDCREASLVRLPEDLGSSPDDVRSVLSAAHHAIDAVARIAIEDREAARAAAADHRLYVPTRLAPEEWDIPYPYCPAPNPLVDELLITYDNAIEANNHAVAALDDLAVTMGTPSHVLATARAVCASQPTPPRRSSNNLADQAGEIQQSDTLPQPGPLGRVLHDLQISEPRALLRAAVIDQAAHELTAEARAQTQRRAAARDVPTGDYPVDALRQRATGAVHAARAIPATTGQARQLQAPGARQ